MYDVFDYLYWRGDLTLEEKPFNEVDNLIMARISYFPLDILPYQTIKLSDAYADIAKFNLKATDYLNEGDLKLFKILATSKRYKDMYLKDFVNIIDYKKEQQFGAVTIIMGDTIYVSYRGTDNTVVGFKEDFNMAFEEVLPSQTEALNYLNNYINTDYHIIVGGHSKGGNMAIYAALNCDKTIQDRIIAIYNNDGPGFLKELKNDAMTSRIHTFIPGSSIVGKLLNNSTNYKIVKSDNKYILQHDLYSWMIDVDKFVYLDNLNKDSIETEKIINDWLNSLSEDEKKTFVDSLYNIISSSNIKTLNDLDVNVLTNLKSLITNYVHTDKANKEIIEKVTLYFINSLKDNMFKR